MTEECEGGILTVVYRVDAGVSVPFDFSFKTGVPAEGPTKYERVGHRLRSGSVDWDSRRVLVGVKTRRGGGLSSCERAARVIVASTNFEYVS